MVGEDEVIETSFNFQHRPFDVELHRHVDVVCCVCCCTDLPVEML